MRAEVGQVVRPQLRVRKVKGQLLFVPVIHCEETQGVGCGFGLCLRPPPPAPLYSSAQPGWDAGRTAHARGW